MIKPADTCGQSLTIGNDTPLPFIDQRKHSIKSQQPQQFPFRYKYTYIREATEPQILNDRLIKKENPCVVQKEINNYKKKIAFTAPKNSPLPQKTYESAQLTCRQTQMRINKTVQKNRSLFASAHKVSSKIASTNNKSANRIIISHKKRKTALSRLKDDRIKPITSQSHLCNYQPYFLNVQKMILVQGDRNKKSQSVIVSNANTDNTNQQKSVIKSNKFYPNSQLIKQINNIKEKFNIQKILQMNQESLQEKAQNLHHFINIKSYESKKQLQRRQQSQSKHEIKSKRYKIETFQQKMNHILKIMQISQQTTKKKQNHIEDQKDKYNLSTPKQRHTNVEKDKKIVFNIQKNEVQTTKKNNSTIKKYKKKFMIPFETYYYRDLLWKVNYTNSLYIQVPIQYQHRLKVFVGKGNNSCMVSGLISRRYWYAFTDRIEQANFVWTQLKLIQFFKKQIDYTNEVPKLVQEQKTYQSHSILTTIDSENYKNYMNTYGNSQQRSDQRLVIRNKAFKYMKIVKSPEIKQLKMQNHLINNYVIGNKKALFNTMSNYYKQTNQHVFDFLPLTFHIKDGLQDKKYFQFLRYFHKKAKQVNKNNQTKKQDKQYNAWIVKPGENSNRGNGIKVCLSLQEIKSILKVRQSYSDGSYRTYIVQQYIQKPLLYFRRKFDLRHYMMITSVNGIIKGYWYRDGYVRTTSAQYSLKFNDGGIHLTNDAVQKQLPQYGKYQKGNKISYDQLNAYIEKYHKNKDISFYQHIYPKMKKIATDTIRACSGGIDPSKLQNNFEVFGLDFMIDTDLNVWLIQVNSNPCLELSCPLLASIIPKMVENTLELTMDAIFPPPVRYSPKGLHYLKQLQKQNKYELVYDERVERLYSGSLQFLDRKLLEQEDDVFEDCGDDWQDS